MGEVTVGVDDAQAARLARKIRLALRTSTPIWKVRGEHREERWKTALGTLPADVQRKIRHRQRIEGDPAWLELSHRIRAAGPAGLDPLASAWTALTKTQDARAREHLGPALAAAADAAARRAPPTPAATPSHEVPPPHARRDAAAQASSLEIALHSPRTRIWQVRWDTPEPRWEETLRLLTAGERRQIRQREAEQDTPRWLELTRHVLALLPTTAEDVATPYVVGEWRTLKPERARDARESVGDVLADAIEAAIRREEERERIEREEETMRAKEAYVDAAQAAVITGPNRLHHAAVSGLPIAQLRAGGLAEKDVARVKAIRSEAMLVGAAAACVGVPRGRLDRWEREGRIACSYHKRMQVHGAGWVEARLWTTRDAKKIARKVPRLEREDAKARAEKRKAAPRRKRAGPDTAQPEIAQPDTARVKVRRVQAIDQAPRDLATEAERLDDMVLRTWRARIGFAPAILADAERAAAKRPQDSRADLRALAFVTIDPDTARDHDDAVLCERTAGGWTLHVAIADVAAFVRPGSRLDTAVALRGQSLYLPTTCVPMCPPVLSERACSLVAGEDRLALYTRLQITRNGTVTSAPHSTMRPALVRVRDRLTYRSAERALREGDAMLTALDECAAALGARRRARGCIVLEWSEEVDLTVRPDGRVSRPTRRRRLRSEQLIEEAMIAHNVRAAEWLAHTVKAPGAIYRTHDAPGYEELEQGVETARSAGVRCVQTDDPRTTLTEMLAAHRGTPKQRWAELGARVAMPKALYSHVPGTHFALAETLYAHTTSPIRRYADLVNQRCAHAAHTGRPQDQPPPSERLIGDLVQDEQHAVRIERESTKRIVVLSLRQHPPPRWIPGTVTGVQPFGLFVEADEAPGAQALCHVSEIDGDWYEYDGARLVAETTGLTWHLGQRIEIDLGAFDTQGGRIDARVRLPRSRARSRRTTA